MTRQKFIQASIDTILRHQSDNGAFVACPNFAAYHYSWLRDGSFIAYSLDLVGRHAAAAKFYRWVHEAIAGQREHLGRLLDRSDRGEPVALADFLPARYTLEGKVEDDEWPNFQLDGYGTWLWGLREHVRLSGDDRLVAEVRPSIDACYAYLSRFWQRPNYDCWEEFGDRVHASTLACIYGGAAAMAELLDSPEWGRLAEEVRGFIRTECVSGGKFVKSVGHGNVDASLLWLSVPFGVVAPDDPVMAATARDIDDRLNHRGGVHRYPEDTYYGGGEWLLLSSWLGWYFALTGEPERARTQLEWVERHANADGTMPEQVLEHVHVPEKIEEWVQFWGQPADPLLWSHAMYLVLEQAVSRAESGEGTGVHV